MTKASVTTVYVEQFGGWWSLRPRKWLEICKKVAEDKGFEFNFNDVGKPLKGRPKQILKNTSGDMVDYWAVSSEHWLRRPLDWKQEDYADEIKNLNQAGVK